MREYDIKHWQNVRAYMRYTRTLFWRSADRLARIYGELPPVDVFDLDAMPQLKQAINRELRRLAGEMQGGIVTGMRNEWTLANNKNDDIVKGLLGGRVLPAALDEKYMNRNIAGLKGFVGRTTDGMGLSDRIWQTVKGHSVVIEQHMGLGILDGTPAKSLATEMKKHLNEPDRLFRRVRDKEGKLRLSKAAKAYKPGRGQYRSAYKNALRMTRTETNEAYRHADYLRRQEMDFIKEIEIVRSGVRYPCDICEEKAGRYPKDFQWTGWHPNCDCYTVSVLPSEEEFIKNL